MWIKKVYNFERISALSKISERVSQLYITAKQSWKRNKINMPHDTLILFVNMVMLSVIYANMNSHKAKFKNTVRGQTDDMITAVPISYVFYILVDRY